METSLISRKGGILEKAGGGGGDLEKGGMTPLTNYVRIIYHISFRKIFYRENE